MVLRVKNVVDAFFYLLFSSKQRYSLDERQETSLKKALSTTGLALSPTA